MDLEFLELISLADRVHRHCLHLIKAELEQAAGYDINPTQALILLKIGQFAVSPTELMVRGWYPGTNPSYNVKRLVDVGLLTRQQRSGDRRSRSLRLTERGHQLRRLLLGLYRRQAERAAAGALSAEAVAAAAAALQKVDQSLLLLTPVAADKRGGDRSGPRGPHRLRSNS